jgi:hypothetical protein
VFNNNLPVSSLFCLLLLDFASLSSSLSSCTHPLHFYVLLPFMLCAHSHSMHLLSSVFQLLHSPPSSHCIPHRNNPYLFFFSSYALCASCACPVSNGSACSACRVLCLFIMATLQLLCLLIPCVHHHWVS